MKKIKKLQDLFDHYKFSEFDIIIDDGSHNMNDILIGIKLFFRLVKSKGLYIIEDFKHPNYYQYNNNINHIFIDELFENLENKKIFSSNIFQESDQKNLINLIEKIEKFKGNLNDSDISFITKN